MAEPFDTLLQVQAHDTTLDQLHHRWETLPERAALAAEAARRRALAGELAEVQAAVDDLVARQRALEERIASSARRRHELEERMRTGAAFAPRDLQAMDHEVHQLEERQRHLEEEEITLLEEEEPLDEALAGHRRTEAELAAEVERLEAAIAEAGVTIRAAVAEEERQRAGLRGPAPVRPGRAVRATAVPSGGGRRGPAGRRPVRRLSPHPAVGRGRAHPRSTHRRHRLVPPVRPDPGARVSDVGPGTGSAGRPVRC